MKHALLAFLAVMLPLGAAAQIPLVPPAAEAPAETAAPEAPAAVTLDELIATLSDDASRADLLAQLETLREVETADEEVVPVPLAQRLADRSARAVEEGWRRARILAVEAARLPGLAVGFGRALLVPETAGMLWRLVAVIAATQVAMRLAHRGMLRWLVRQPLRRQGFVLPFRTRLRRFGMRMLSGVLAVLLGWVAGYAVALALGGGDVPQEAALYLNAYVVVGLFGIGLSAVVSRVPGTMTLSDLPLHAQKIIARRVRLVVATAVYGIMVAVPVAQALGGLPARNSVRTLVIVLSAAIALYAVARIRRAMGAVLDHEQAEAEARRRRRRGAEDGDVAADMGRASGRAWLAIWPWLAYAYVLGCFVIALTRPALMGALVIRGTVFTVIALVLVTVGQRLLRGARSAAAQAPAPEGAVGFRARLKGLAGPARIVLALVAFASAVLVLLDGWRIVDLGELLERPEVGARVWGLVSAAAIVVALVILWSAVSVWIDRKLAGTGMVTSRQRTLLALFRNAFTVALVIFGAMIALSELGIDIAPLIAGAGVVGLAIGFGAQKLVQDIITGIFIQLENAMDVGDVVTAGPITGAVEKLTIRSVGLRTLDGVYHIVPFSAVDVVSNFMRGFSFHVREMGVAYGENVPAVKAAMQEAFERLRRDPEQGPNVLGEFDMQGVTGFADSAVLVRARIKTLPGAHWGVGRLYDELLKAVFDERGIEIPFPHRQIMLSDDALKALSPRPQAAAE
ncbi:small-conductance mechanosensitive channel [Hasllibacter halocynthiae]|uniref:Small-conductance mechanosensitive channel n=1 Tax=Hasllibacter halocynthiae TaxID=595589 RepID=A0A2T0X6B3_9RHOB|nr:mechanosensitive ion channel domain-containing protein [Hasllibacter halocynthiae]PRY94414.1 small-conductance mechanosensitive channel [Hasllibacter halocynthiae]